MLDIHELRREVLGSGGVVPPFLASLPRLSIVGRFGGIFWGVDVAVVAGEAGGEADCWTADAGAGAGAAGSPWLWFGLMGRPPCDDVLGEGSRVRPGDDGACWRWWWSVVSQLLVRHSGAHRGCHAFRLGRLGGAPSVSGAHLL